MPRYACHLRLTKLVCVCICAFTVACDFVLVADEATPSAPVAPSTPQPSFAAFPGFWFDYLPDVISTEAGWELKLRVGLPAATAVNVVFLDEKRNPLASPAAASTGTGTADASPASAPALANLRIPITTSAADRSQGRLQLLTIPVPADLRIRFIRLTTEISTNDPAPATLVQVLVELRDSTASLADLTLAALPPDQRIGTADNLTVLARGQNPLPPAGNAWATLGAHLASATDGHPLVIRHQPRAIAEDRSGLVTRIFRPPAPPDSNAPPQRWLVVAPAVLAQQLQATRAWHSTQVLRLVTPAAPATESTAKGATATSALTSAPASTQPGPAVTAPVAPAVGATPVPAPDLVLIPAATETTPFHPVAGLLATACAAIDTNACDNLLVILPWDDALYGTDPREFSLAIDALAEHFRAQHKAGPRPLHDLVLLGPFHHPSVPEKRHTMMESNVSERQRAQRFQWPDAPPLKDPLMWRLNPASDALAIYGPVPNTAGFDRLQDVLKSILP